MECRICKNGRDATPIDKRIGLYSCGTCGHVFKDIPKEEQEQYAEDYFSEQHKNWFKHPNYGLFRLLKRKIAALGCNTRMRVLDIGCGKGDFLKYLRDSGLDAELYGIDLSPNRIEGVKFIRGDIVKEKFDMKFNVISCLAAIEHIDSPELVIEKAKSILDDVGILLLMTDNCSGMIYKVSSFLKRIRINLPYDTLYSRHNIHFFSNGSLRMLIESMGFEVVYHRNHNYPLKAVDIPSRSMVMMCFYKLGVAAVFGVTSAFRSGMLQTVICKRRRMANAF